MQHAYLYVFAHNSPEFGRHTEWPAASKDLATLNKTIALGLGRVWIDLSAGRLHYCMAEYAAIQLVSRNYKRAQTMRTLKL